MVQGTGDEVCPEVIAQQLAAGLKAAGVPHTAYFFDAGHSAKSDGMSKMLRRCVDEFGSEAPMARSDAPWSVANELSGNGSTCEGGLYYHAGVTEGYRTLWLLAPDTGVLCWIDFRLKVGTSTVSGSAPFATPYSAVPGFVIAADAMVAVPDASTFIVGDVVALAGFVKVLQFV